MHPKKPRRIRHQSPKPETTTITLQERTYTPNSFGTGRPTILTEELSNVIVESIRNGATREAAANAVGIDRTTLFEWIKKGRAGTEPYVHFHNALTRAEGDCEVQTVNLLKSLGAAGDSKALMFLLERRFPETWGLTHTVNVKVRNEIVEFLEALRLGLDSDTFAKVLDIAANRVDMADPDALPPPTITKVEDAD